MVQPPFLAVVKLYNKVYRDQLIAVKHERLISITKINAITLCMFCKEVSYVPCNGKTIQKKQAACQLFRVNQTALEYFCTYAHQILAPASRFGRSSQLSPAAITQLRPFGRVRMMVKVPVGEARISITAPLLARPMETGVSEYVFSRLATTVLRSPHIACAFASFGLSATMTTNARATPIVSRFFMVQPPWLGLNSITKCVEINLSLSSASAQLILEPMLSYFICFVKHLARGK